MIVLNIIVRNEADILEELISHYLEQGVSKVIAIDNGSTDGTADILDGFVRLGVAEVVYRDGGFRQTEWGLELVHRARDRYAPAWIIAPDADEFVVASENETIAAHLNRRTTAQVIVCPRINLFPTREDFLAGRWREKPLFRSMLGAPRPSRYYEPTTPAQYPFVCYPIAPKVVFRPANVIALSKGSHTVELDPPAECVQTGLVMWHLPMRQPERLLTAIERRIPVLEREASTPQQSNQYRRWAAMLRDARTRGEGIEAMMPDILPDAEQMAEYIRAGVVVSARPPFKVGHAPSSAPAGNL
jgi:hypothetical protein